MIEEELKIAIHAALKAGQEIMEVYQGEFAFELKNDNSPLTIADKRANSVITSILEETTIPIISEESKQISYSERKNWNRCWIVDPLDGTKEFIKRNGEFTVNIALVENGEPQLGVIYVPDQHTVYFGSVQTNSAFKYTIVDERQTIDDIVSNADRLKKKTKELKSIQVVGSRSHMNQETNDFIDTIKNQGKKVEVISIGSSLKFCLVAEGKADVYPRYAPTMEWDTAAAHAICNASGVHVRNALTNSELNYNKKDLLNPWFICE